MGLINCHECKNQISDLAFSCPHCGAPRNESASIIGPEIISSRSQPENPNTLKTYITCLWNGEIALVKTYWLYYVLAGLPLGMVLWIAMQMENTIWRQVVATFVIVYTIFMNVAVWRSATKYEGAKIWAILAKIAAGFNQLIYAAIIFGLIFISIKSKVSQNQDSLAKTQFSNNQQEQTGKYNRDAVENESINIEDQLSRKLLEMAVAGNKKLPMMVDKNTRLDLMLTGPSMQLIYFYTLPDYASINVSREWITTDIKPKVTKEVCAEQGLRKLLTAGATLTYVYNGNDDIAINNFQVRDSDCLQTGSE